MNNEAVQFDINGTLVELSDATARQTLEGKYEKPETGIPLEDLSQTVKDGLHDSFKSSDVTSMDGYEVAASVASIESGDTLIQALGKIEKKILNLRQVIEDNELVTAAALNSLKERAESYNVKDYFTIVPLENGTISFSKSGLQYSTDKTAWTSWDGSSLSVTSGTNVYLKGTMTPVEYEGIGTFSSTNNFSVEGNVMSLLYGDNFVGQTSLSGYSYAFYNLFYYCVYLISAENLILPATTLAEQCYQGMFEGCSSLTTAPALPATTLAYGCYNCMFVVCTSLTTAPATLPATTLADYCYQEMFEGCSSLTTAPATLPATTLADYCYNSMFNGCTSLTTAPELPATTLASNCYNCMFYGCTSLTTAPELPATTLVSSCYYLMFYDCTSLNYIKCLATDISASNCTNNWVNGVAASGTFVKDPNMSGWTIGNNGIPSGWYDYSQDYFTIVPQGRGKIYLDSASNNIYLEYSKNSGSTWTTIYSGGTQSVSEIDVTNGDKVLFKGTASAPSGSGEKVVVYPQNIFSTDVNYSIEGNIMSLVCGDDFLSKVDLTNFDGNGTSVMFYYMFIYDTYLVSAENLSLPATTLANSCYYSMFYSCTSLTTAPELPATTLTESCYNNMFYGCTSLNYIKCLATNISATTCTNNWVSNVAATGTFVKDPSMTAWSTGVNGIPSGWTVEDYDIYSNEYLTIVSNSDNNTIGWQASDTSIQKTISISTNNGQTWTNKTSSTSTSGTTLATLNNGDKLLIKGSNTAYGTSSYYNCFTSTQNFDVEGNIMSLLYGDNFIGQTSLDGKDYAFRTLFYSNTYLVNAQNLKLPATTLASNCYRGMFYNCTRLTTAPELPATTLADWCYYYMFQGCTSLTTAPTLPATTLADRCYYYMFQGCRSLTTAPTLLATTLTQYCYAFMFYDCTSLNYIKCLATDISATTCTTDWVNGVAATGTFVKDPNMSGWTTGTSGIPNGWTVEGGPSLSYFTIVPTENGTISFSKSGLQYSTDGENWSELGTSELSVTSGTNVYLKGTMTPSQPDGIGTFSSSNNFNIEGNAMSLLYGNNFSGQTSLSGKTYAFDYLFSGCTHLVSAENLSLPATTLAQNCYREMFWGCTSLTTAPALPATRLASYCYINMFRGCTSLTTAPELPATTLASYCYANMFYGCSSLTTAPELPATTLASYCYSAMFSGGCTSLNYIKCLATNISASNCTYKWVNGVAATGTFVKDPSMTAWSTGVNGIPTNWTVQDAS